MGGFSKVIGSSITNLAGSILNAPTSIINSLAGGGSSVIDNSAGFFGGLFNRNTGASIAAGGGGGLADQVKSVGLQGSLNIGGDEDFLMKNKGLFSGVLLVTLILGVVYFIFGKKKKVGVRRRRRTSTTTTKTFRARSVGKKKASSSSFKKVKQSTYDGYTRKQKNIYNLKKARAVRAKTKK